MSDQRRITRGDIEAQLRTLQGDVNERVVSEKQKIITGALVTLALLLAVSYVLGRRKGRRKTTIVEIRRV
jgi:hypothetical protein